MNSGKPRRWNRVAHAAWAALAVCISMLLIFAGKGHPPPVIFLPAVVVVWALGHLALWGTGWMAAKGARQRSEGAAAAWPMGLRFVLAGTGIAAFAGIVQLAATLLLRKFYPFPDAALWTSMLTVWLVHGACLAGLLLRRPWSRFLSIMLALGWALLLAAQMVEPVMRGQRVDNVSLLIAGGSVALLLWLGFHLAISARVKSFLSH